MPDRRPTTDTSGQKGMSDRTFFFLSLTRGGCPGQQIMSEPQNMSESHMHPLLMWLCTATPDMMPIMCVQPSAEIMPAHHCCKKCCPQPHPTLHTFVHGVQLADPIGTQP